eukprot:11679264-Ditylum_brightwellii.AAC.1
MRSRRRSRKIKRRKDNRHRIDEIDVRRLALQLTDGDMHVAKLELMERGGIMKQLLDSINSYSKTRGGKKRVYTSFSTMMSDPPALCEEDEDFYEEDNDERYNHHHHLYHSTSFEDGHNDYDDDSSAEEAKTTSFLKTLNCVDLGLNDVDLFGFISDDENDEQGVTITSNFPQHHHYHHHRNQQQQKGQKSSTKQNKFSSNHDSSSSNHRNNQNGVGNNGDYSSFFYEPLITPHEGEVMDACK